VKSGARVDNSSGPRERPCGGLPRPPARGSRNQGSCNESILLYRWYTNKWNGCGMANLQLVDAKSLLGLGRFGYHRYLFERLSVVCGEYPRNPQQMSATAVCHVLFLSPRHGRPQMVEVPFSIRTKLGMNIPVVKCHSSMASVIRRRHVVPTLEPVSRATERNLSFCEKPRWIGRCIGGVWTLYCYRNSCGACGGLKINRIRVETVYNHCVKVGLGGKVDAIAETSRSLWILRCCTKLSRRLKCSPQEGTTHLYAIVKLGAELNERTMG